MPELTADTHGKTIGSGIGETVDEIFAKYPPAQFTVAGTSYAFPVIRITENGSNRIVERQRPYRDGAKLDDVGSNSKRWVLEAVFENTVIEPGIDATNQNRALYPTVLNELILLFDIHETGDLVVPTVGIQRVRAESYVRTESSEPRDCAMVTFTFVEDNEDGIGFRSITQPSANANARRLADEAQLDAQSTGAWDGSLSDLDEFTRELEDLVNQPGEVSQDVEAQALRIQGNAKRANQTFMHASRPGRDLFLDPGNSRGPRNITRQEDMAVRETLKSRRGRPRLVVVTFRESTSIFQIGAFVGQDPADLMAVNPRLDPFFIEAYAPVKVFATEAFLNGSNSAA